MTPARRRTPTVTPHISTRHSTGAFVGLLALIVLGLALWLFAAVLPILLIICAVAAVIWVLDNDSAMVAIDVVLGVAFLAFAGLCVAGIVSAERVQREDRRRKAAGEPSLGVERAERKAEKDAAWLRDVRAKQRRLRVKHGPVYTKIDCWQCRGRIRHMSAEDSGLELHGPIGTARTSPSAPTAGAPEAVTAARSAATPSTRLTSCSPDRSSADAVRSAVHRYGHNEPAARLHAAAPRSGWTRPAPAIDTPRRVPAVAPREPGPSPPGG